MKNELKNNLTYQKTMLILSALCIASGLLTLILAEAAIPLVAALLSAILLFEREGQRRYSYFVCAALIVINLVFFFSPFTTPTLFSLTAIPFAYLIYNFYTRTKEKAECAFYMTAIATICMIVTLILIPMLHYGSLSFAVVGEFYGELMDTVREEIVLALNDMLNSLPTEQAPVFIDPSMVDELFNQQLSMMISYLIVFSFLLAGVTLKLFGAIVTKCAQSTEQISLWRFKTTSIFAYFFIILTVISFFISSTDTIFAVTVLNLYNVLLYVYFYVGFNVAVGFLSRNRRRTFAFLIVIFAVLLFATYAIELLAIIGAFFTVRENSREIKSE